MGKGVYDTNSPHFKGTFLTIYAVNQKYQAGGVDGDWCLINGWAHYWDADRGTWCVNSQRDTYWDELFSGVKFNTENIMKKYEHLLFDLSKKANTSDVQASLEELKKEIGDRTVVEGNVTNLPDEEDITSGINESGTDVLSLKDRVYKPLSFSGKGYKILRKNIKPVSLAVTKIIVGSIPTVDGAIVFAINGVEASVDMVTTTMTSTDLVAQKIAEKLTETMTEYEVSVDASLITLTRKSGGSVTSSAFSASTTGVVCTITDSTKREFRNILTPAMINQSNTLYEIRYDFDLDGVTIEMQEGCTLKFNGGKVHNGKIVFNKTNLSGDIKCYTHIDGTLTDKLGTINVSWFNPYINVLNTDCSHIINEIFLLAYNHVNANKQETPMAIYFPHGRYYIAKELVIPTKVGVARKFYLYGDNVGTTTELIAFGKRRRFVIGKSGGVSSDANELNITMRNLRIDANNLCDYACYLPLTSLSYFDNCIFSSANLANVYMTYSFSNTFINCTFAGFDVRHPCGYNFYGGYQWTNALTFIGCRFEGCAYVGISIYCGYNVKITGCTIEGHDACGIYVNNVDGLSIDGNYFEDNGISKNNFVSREQQGFHFKKVLYNGVQYNDYNFECHADIVLNDAMLPFNNYSEHCQKFDVSNIYNGTVYDDKLKELFNNVACVSSKLDQFVQGIHPFEHTNAIENTRRPIFITNNSTQRISGKLYENDCFVFSNKTEGITLMNNTLTSIGLDGDMGYAYDDFESEVLIISLLESSFPHQGITMIGNMSQNKTKNTFKLLSMKSLNILSYFVSDIFNTSALDAKGDAPIKLYNISSKTDVKIDDNSFKIELSKGNDFEFNIKSLLNPVITHGELISVRFKCEPLTDTPITVIYNESSKTIIAKKGVIYNMAIVSVKNDVDSFSLTFKGIANENNQVLVTLLEIKTQTTDYYVHTDYCTQDLANINRHIILEDGKEVKIYFGKEKKSPFVSFYYDSAYKELGRKQYNGTALTGYLSYDAIGKKVRVFDNGYKDCFGNDINAQKTGNSASRPANVKFGFIYKNTETNKWEIFNGSSWENLDGTQITDV